MMDLNIQIVKVMVERMTAKRVRLFSTESLQPSKEILEEAVAASEEVPAGGEGRELKLHHRMVSWISRSGSFS